MVGLGWVDSYIGMKRVGEGIFIVVPNQSGRQQPGNQPLADDMRVRLVHPDSIAGPTLLIVAGAAEVVDDPCGHDAACLAWSGRELLPGHQMTTSPRYIRSRVRNAQARCGLTYVHLGIIMLKIKVMVSIAPQ